MNPHPEHLRTLFFNPWIHSEIIDLSELFLLMSIFSELVPFIFFFVAFTPNQLISQILYRISVFELITKLEETKFYLLFNFYDLFVHIA